MQVNCWFRTHLLGHLLSHLFHLLHDLNDISEEYIRPIRIGV